MKDFLSNDDVNVQLGEVVYKLRHQQQSIDISLVRSLSDFLRSAMQSLRKSTPPNGVGSSELNVVFERIAEMLSYSDPRSTTHLKVALRNLVLLTKCLERDELFEEWTRYTVALPISKEVFYIFECLGQYVPSKYAWGITEQFYIEAFHFIVSSQYASPVGKGLSSLLGYRNTPLHTWVAEWQKYVTEFIVGPAREKFSIYFLEPMLQSAPKAFDILYKNLETYSRSSDKFGQQELICCLKAAVNAGIDVSPYLAANADTWLTSYCPSLRSEALCLLLNSRSQSSPVDPKLLDSLKSNMHAILGDADAKYRNQNFGVIRKFIFRLKSSSYAQHRKRNYENVAEVRMFLEWFVSHLCSFLIPGSPYRLLIAGCKYLELLVLNGVDSRVSEECLQPFPVHFPFSIDVFSDDLVVSLMNLVPNDYQDVRQISSHLLSVAPKSFVSLFDEPSLILRTESLLSGIRGRQGEGGARLAYLLFSTREPSEGGAFYSHLLDSLATHLESAKFNIQREVRHHGVHGYFMALELISKGRKLCVVDTMRIIELVHLIWEVAEGPLTNGAPEGNKPFGLTETCEDEQIDSKQDPISQLILSYSWRGLKEAMTLLETVLNSPTEFSDSLIRELGDFLLELLQSIRHRGAFSAVAPSFSACCARCYASPALESVPMSFYEKSLNAVIDKPKLITRRSAGLPFVVVSIANSSPNAKDVDILMAGLLKVAKIPTSMNGEENKLDLPQVHAMNCIRSLFMSSSLTKATQPHVEDMLILATSLFDSRVWSLRNCAVMLFSTLHNRLFGARVAFLPAHVFFAKYKRLGNALLGLIESAASDLKSTRLEMLFPVLSILLRLRPVDKNTTLQSFEPHVAQLLSSPIWKTREIAARVLSIICTKERLLQVIESNLKSVTLQNHNFVHGFFMMLTFAEIETFPVHLVSKAIELYLSETCYETKIVVLKFILRCNCLSLIPHDFEAVGSALDPSHLVHDVLLAEALVHENPQTALKLLEDQRPQILIATLNCIGFCATEPLIKAVVEKMTSWKNYDLLVCALSFVLSHEKVHRTIQSSSLSFIGTPERKPMELRHKCVELLGTCLPESEAQFSVWFDTILHDLSDSDSAETRNTAGLCILRLLRQRVIESTDDLNYKVLLMLSDDSEDLRGTASRICSEILKVNVLAPSVCERALVERISPQKILQVIESQDLIGEARDALIVDESLFVTEKSNLYRDELQFFELLVMRLRSNPLRSRLKAVADAIEFDVLNLDTLKHKRLFIGSSLTLIMRKLAHLRSIL